MTSQAASRPVPDVLSEVGPATADALASRLDGLVDEVLAAVVAAVPPFEQWLADERGVREAVEDGIRGFLEGMRGADQTTPPSRQRFFDFGRVEHRAGRSLDALLTAYRVGAQATWRGIARAGEDASFAPRTLYRVAEEIFGYIDRLSSATAEGYAYEEAIAAGDRVDLRRRLVETLLSGAPGDELADVAAVARWTVPRRLAVVAFHEGRTATVASRLPADAVVTRIDGVGYVVVPDIVGVGRLAAVRRAVEGLPAGLGPPVPPTGAPESARRALMAMRLHDAEAPELVLADERRLELLLLHDPALAYALAEELAEALGDRSPRERERLLETLEAWLEHQGAVRSTAEALGIHMQTVRYRVVHLRAMLGNRLELPRARLELELAVRATRLVAAGVAGPDPR